MDRREKILLSTTLAALVLSVGAVGGAPRWAQALVTGVAGSGVLATAWSRRSFGRRSPLLLLLLLMIASTALQLMPLPSALSELLSPTVAALRADGAELVGLELTPRITVDPGSTLRALTTLIALAALAIVALRLSASERGRYLLLASVASVCGITAVVAGVHGLLGAHRLYGIYEPHQAGSSVTGPLLNPNHMGCLMAIGASVAAGLLMYPRQTVAKRAMWALVTIACIALLASTHSRGAMLALAVGTLTFLVTVIVQRTRIATHDRKTRRRRHSAVVTTIPLMVIVVCAITSALYVGADRAVDQLENTSLNEINVPTSKFEAWRSAVSLVSESPWAGIGRGGFEPAFTRVHAASAFAIFSHPENTLVQAVVEWGVPTTLVVCGVAVWVALFGLRRWKDGPLAAGAIGAISAVGFQSNFDFGIELLGLAAPITIVASTLCYSSLKELRPSRLRATRGFRIAIALIAVGASICLLLPITMTLDEDHRALAENPTRERLLESIERHPLDYYGYAVLAEQMLRGKQPEAVRVLNHALRLHPTHPGLHRLAARLLFRSGSKNQAELEYAIALSYSVKMEPLLAEMVSVMTPDEIVQAIPRNRAVGNVVRALQAVGRLDIAIRWLGIALDERPTYETAQTLYSLAMTQQELPAAERAARARCRIIPGNQCQLALARVLELQRKPKEVVIALRDVASWRGRTDERRAAWFMLCDAHTAVGAIDEARTCLRLLDSSGLVPSNDSAMVRRQETLQNVFKQHLLNTGENAK